MEFTSERTFDPPTTSNAMVNLTIQNHRFEDTDDQRMAPPHEQNKICKENGEKEVEGLTKDSTMVVQSNSYGDFIFRRFSKKLKKSCYTGEVYRDYFWRQGSNGLPVKELGGFKRSGPFPYFKLPTEIRLRIIELLLGPFYFYDYETKVSGIMVQVLENESDSNYSSRCFENYPEFLARSRKMHPFHFIEYRMQEIEFLAMKSGNLQERMLHPTRSSKYVLNFPFNFRPVRDANLKFFEDDTDLYLIEWIRQLSTVSKNLTADLGDVFWTLASIYGEASFIQAFLEDRSAIHSKISKLTLEIPYEPCVEGSEAYTKTFTDLCKYLTKNLNLLELRLNLRLKLDELTVFSLGQDQYAYLLNIRKIPVRESFDVIIIVVLPDNYRDEDGNLPEGFSFSDLLKKYKPAILEHLLPDTLRVPEDLTQATAYLKSRDRVSDTTSKF